ncbi:hypothetical protein LIER_15456 [Lithospermum erythrorhizon]|uniref:Uncharacterized protein n=1 Tax=Lithospermum erythrorhizon TaxID=34254 RepID=A0AAV3Q4X7_LITER
MSVKVGHELPSGDNDGIHLQDISGHRFDEGKAPMPGSRYKPGQSYYPTGKALSVLLSLGTLHGLYHCYLIRIRIDALLADHVPQELSLGYAKDTLIQVET